MNGFRTVPRKPQGKNIKKKVMLEKNSSPFILNNHLEYYLVLQGCAHPLTIPTLTLDSKGITLRVSMRKGQM